MDFDEWLNEVDNILWDSFGYTVDKVDVPWESWYERGLEPSEAVLYAREEDETMSDL